MTMMARSRGLDHQQHIGRRRTTGWPTQLNVVLLFVVGPPWDAGPLMSAAPPCKG
ncbi:unnamed protein product, partial [Strongylus vulgaris]